MSNTPGNDMGGDAGADEGLGLDEAIAAAWDTVDTSATDHDMNSDPAQARPDAAAASVDPNNRETPAAAADKAPATPDRWSAEEQAQFARLPPEAKALVEKRVGAIEADYAKRTQEVASDVEMAKGVKQIADGFRDRLGGMSELDGVKYLADLEAFASAQPADYLRFVADHVRKMGIDPAAVLGFTGQTDPNASDDAFVDPRVATLEQRLGTLTNHIQQDAQRRALDAAGTAIASFRDAKDASGNLLRPYLAEVEDDMAALIKAKPKITLEEAYDAAVWSNPTVRAKLQEADRSAGERKSRSEAANAAKAAKANVRTGQRSMTSTPNINSSDDAVRAALADLGM